MKKIIVFALATITALFCFVSCEEDQSDATQVVVRLRSGDTRQNAIPGDKILFEFYCVSMSSKLKSFSIKSLDIEYGEKVYVDVPKDEASFNYMFVYDVPAFTRDSVVVALKARADDFDNNHYELNLWVTVKDEFGLMPELSGVVLFSGSSHQRNAFSLLDPSQPFVMALADSASIDIYDFPNDIAPETLSREWRTNTDVRFAKANNLNYAGITASGIRASYASSVRQQFVSGLQVNDIILIGKNNVASGVIMITEVADNEETDNDFYRFSIKMIR